MELLNESGWNAHMFRGVVDDDLMIGTVVLRSGFVVGGNGALKALAHAPQIRLEDEDTEHGFFEHDGVPKKDGVDVMVFGAAYAPSGRTTDMRVSVTVNDRVFPIHVIGDRRWRLHPRVDVRDAMRREANGTFDPEAATMTEPEPFEVMPVTWSRAFGGQAETTAGPVPWPANPEGRGVVLSVERLHCALLPNLEDPTAPIRTWLDRPRPACFASLPRSNPARLERGASVDEDLQLTLNAKLFNAADDRLVFPALHPGSGFVVEGMASHGTFAFELPHAPWELDVALGDRRASVPVHLDGIELWPEQRSVVLVHRGPFRYRIHPQELRSARLFWNQRGVLSCR